MHENGATAGHHQHVAQLLRLSRTRDASAPAQRGQNTVIWAAALDNAPITWPCYMIGLERMDGFLPYLPADMTPADAAHELNNLMTVVLGSLEQLQRQGLDERGKAQLDRAQTAITQANALLQHLVVPQNWAGQTTTE